MKNRGRPRTSNRTFEHHLDAIDAADLTKQPGFKPEIRYDFISDVPEPVLRLSTTLQWKDGSTTSVKLETTRPNYGGTRYWFKCTHCGRRKRKLYVGSDHDLACRTCFGLVYESQYRKGPRAALFREIRKIIA